MAAGRPKKPRAKKVLEGTFRKDRNPIKEPEPTLASDVKPPPEHLNRWGKQLWDSVVQELVDTGVMAVVDWSELEMCCTAYGMFREAHHEIYHYTDEAGKKRKRTLGQYMENRSANKMPEMTTLRTSYEMYRTTSANLGLNPVARNKIDLAPRNKQEISETEKILNEVSSE